MLEESANGSPPEGVSRPRRFRPGRTVAVLGGLILVAFAAYILLVPALENDAFELTQRNTVLGKSTVLGTAGASTTSDGYFVLGL